MPLFGHRDPTPPPPPPQVETAPTRKSTLFSRRHRSTSPSSTEMGARNERPKAYANGNGNGDGYNADAQPSSGTRRGFFSRRRSSSTSDDYDNASTGRGGSMRSGAGTGMNSSIHGRETGFANDPVIMGARQKVADAEAAEQSADRALIEARAAVRDARQEVKDLERTIAEEARLAKLRQQEAKAVSKSAKGLGRHG